MAAPCDDANRYELEGLLGRGAMGVVYRARERASGRAVALKLLETPSAKQRLARFQREGEVTAALNHPGIVRVHSTGTLQGKPFLAYELVEGARPLDQVLRQATLRQRVRLLRDVAAALGYAHARGVVHRDVKPDNVLVDASGTPRVLDFGVAAQAAAERLTQTGAMVGTPAYMAPEQLRGQRPSPATDVWALGVMLYEALTSVRPFDAESLPTLFAQVHAGRPRRPRELEPSVPGELEAICLRALDTEPTSRPHDGQALAASLDAWLEGRTPAADGGRLRLVALAAAACLVSCVLAWVTRGEAVPRVADGAGAVAPEPPADVAPDAPPVPADPDPEPLVQLLDPDAERAPLIRLTAGLAAAGDPGALLSMGRYHAEGKHGCVQDHALAADYYQRAVAAGSLEALRELAAVTRQGLGVPQNMAAAAALVQEAAQAGEAESMAWLGWHHEEGQGVPQDDALAATWYRRAGSVRLAQRRLAQLLLKGRAEPEAGEDPIALLTAAASTGSKDAHLDLGLLYLRGSLVPQDRRRARYHLERARAGEAAPYLAVLDQEDAE